MTLRIRLLAALSIVFLSLSARAGDWYVDAVHGSNANAGTAPTQAWRTITHAVASVPTSGIQRVIVAAGRYDEALGETFPIRMHDKLQLLGAGPDSTEIVNTQMPLLTPYESQAGVVICRVAPELGGQGIGTGTALAGFRISSTRDLYTWPFPSVGVWVATYSYRCQLEMRDLVLDYLGWGIRVDGYSDIDVSRVQLRFNGEGLYMVDFGNCTASEITVADNYSGITYGGYWGPHTAVSISRSRIERNVFNGIRAGAASHGFSNPGHVILNLSDCLIAHNRVADPVWASIVLSADEYSSGQLRLERCSLIENEKGIVISRNGPITATIDSCLLQNHGDDLEVLPFMATVRYSNISDGDYVGINGNISAPALFVDPANGDWRLRFDSPGIDAGNPAIPAGTLDLLGTPRSIDGDLDTLERADIGAFEFAPLYRQGPGRIGSRLKLECWGPAGSTASLYVSRRPLLALPLSTPFGEFDLDPLHAGVLGVSPVGQSAPVIFEHLIPNDPALIGQTFSFQARTRSALAPAGAAYTNGVQFSVLP